MQLVWAIGFGIFFGFVAGHYAEQRGRNRKKWFVIGFFFGLLGLISLFILPKKVVVQETAAVLPLLPPPAPSGKFWYYLDSENKQFGPMSFQALKEANITPMTLVWNEELSDWQTFESFTNLT